MANIVFIATSLDGYIADKQGKLDWLQSVPNPDNIDTGFVPLMERIDGLVMGRNTLDVVRVLVAIGRTASPYSYSAIP